MGPDHLCWTLYAVSVDCFFFNSFTSRNNAELGFLKVGIKKMLKRKFSGC